MEDFYNTTDVTEDLKAFERRMTEYLASLAVTTTRWRIVLFVSSVIALFGAWGLIIDDVHHDSILQSLWYHKLFTLSCCNLIVLVLCGIHRRVAAPNICMRQGGSIYWVNNVPKSIISRTKMVLQDYNMSCDDKGRLILKARPSTPGVED